MKVEPGISMSSTRDLAVAALIAIFEKSKKPKDAIDGLSAVIDKRERAFLMELVYGVLRHRDYLDWIIKAFLKNPSGLSPVTWNNLRTAVYQIRYTRVPEWAAVNEAVDIEKKHNRARAPVVNAVLRNILRYKGDIPAVPKDDPVSYLSVSTSHPLWLVKRWVKRFGYDEASLLANRNNEMPPLTIRVANESERRDALQLLGEKGIRAHATQYSPVGIAVEDTLTFQELSEVLPSKYFVQDEAAQLVAFLLNPSAGERVLDACAAPGGKTTHIAQMMQDSGEIVAVEADERRISQLEENIRRFDLKSVRIVNADVKELDKVRQALFDRILIDAPCSSIGVIRRNPDVKYRHAKKDLQRFKERQKEVLHAVSRLLKSGGSMVYSVCSTEPEEGEEVIREFLQANRNFSIIKGAYDFLAPFEIINKEGMVFYRTFPHKHAMDGFFAARLKKNT